jgi:hypothetical protein
MKYRTITLNSLFDGLDLTVDEKAEGWISYVRQNVTKVDGLYQSSEPEMELLANAFMQGVNFCQSCLAVKIKAKLKRISDKPVEERN